MTRNNDNLRDSTNASCVVPYACKRKAFTIIEILAALAVVSIAIVALLRLQLISINMTDRADATTRAALLAQERLDEILTHDFPAAGTTSGQVEQQGRTFTWQTQITNASLPGLNKNDFAALRRIHVDVSWPQGTQAKHVNLTTYVTPRKNY